MNKVINQNHVVFKSFVLIDKRNEEDVLLNVFDLDEVKLNICIEVLFLRDLRGLSTLIGDLILLFELEFSDLFELHPSKLVLRLEKINLIFQADDRNFTITGENSLHFFSCLGDEKVRLLQERPLFTVGTLFIVYIVVLTNDSKYKAVVVPGLLVTNQPHLSKITEFGVSCICHYFHLCCYHIFVSLHFGLLRLLDLHPVLVSS